jgi:murein DD-endopeptidase MepM/ murein hydrolase activator NlpD
LKIFRSVWNFSVRAFGAGVAVFVLTLSAPLLDTAVDQRTAEIRSPDSEPPPRVGVTLRRGDTLLSVLTRFGLPPQSAYGMIEEIRPVLNPRSLRPGQDLELVFDPYDKSIRAIEVRVGDSLVSVKATTAGWSAERRALDFVRETRVVRGTVSGSLYESGIDAGLTPQQVLDLASIFEYDIDFFSDLDPGDGFAVVIEQLRYADGRRVAGRILAAQIDNDGEAVSAFYFVSRRGGAYYDGSGQALRRRFLRAPLSYVRISSAFSMARQHPISRTVRPHKAIDYAAPAGTPVVAIGPGRVEIAGWAPGYGNLVEIRHNGNRYASRYGHLSKIASGIREGATVNAGEVVGYVGQTGDATGPHLHFEFLNGGEQINFLGLKITGADRLAGAELESFARAREERLAQLRGRRQKPAPAHKPL